MDKRILKLLGLMLLIFVSIFGSIVLIAVLKIHWSLKILIGLLGLTLSIYAFILMQKINKKYLNTLPQPEEKESKELLEAESKLETKNYIFGALRCPKCHKPYDGNTCFYCGYVKENKE